MNKKYIIIDLILNIYENNSIFLYDNYKNI